MEFSQNNHIVKLCLQGMAMEEQQRTEEAGNLFLQAWNKSTNDFERFLAAHCIARSQQNIDHKLHWFEQGLKLATALDNEMSRSAIPFIHLNIAECYEQSADLHHASKHHALAKSCTRQPSDAGPFYHGTKASLQPGDFLTPGYNSNYQSELVMNHIYFTAGINGAALAAALAKGDGIERVYIVEPTGTFEDDPNVTNKKFPGNPTKSYRTESSLKITGEISDYPKLSQEEIDKWREKIASNNGKIIN